MPNTSLSPVYVSFTYMFSVYICLFKCIMHSAYIILACLKRIILNHVPSGDMVYVKQQTMRQ